MSFPYTDLSAAKLRPAVVLAQVKKDDVLICQITSRSYADPNAVELPPSAFSTGGLPKVSYAQVGKLFTCHAGLIDQSIGTLSGDTMNQIVDALVRLLKGGR